jgi:tetratricopeptide (TPR) repeat protein
MKVDILEQQEDGSRRRIASFTNQGGEVVCDNPTLWKHLMNSGGGVVIGARGKRYFPQDGDEYLRNLRYQFAGPYLFAELLEEERKAPTPKPALEKLLATPAPDAIPSVRMERTGERAVEVPMPRAEVVEAPRPGERRVEVRPQAGVEKGADRPARRNIDEMPPDRASSRPADKGLPRVQGREVERPRDNPPPVDRSALKPADRRPVEPAGPGVKSRLEQSERSVPGPADRTAMRPTKAVPGRKAEPAQPEEDPRFPQETRERMGGAAWRLLQAVRGLSPALAREEADGLLKLLSAVAQVDFPALKRSFETREEYLEMRFQTPSRLNYARVWERIQRSLRQFLHTLQEGDLPAALWPLFLLREGLAAAPEHRTGFVNALLLPPQAGLSPCGTSPLELGQSWEKVALPAFRKEGFSVALFDKLIAGATGMLQKAAATFQAADFGTAENQLRVALLMDPAQLDARVLLGDLLRRLDRHDEALAELAGVIEQEYLTLKIGTSQSSSPESWQRIARTRGAAARLMLARGEIRGSLEQLELGIDAFEQLSRRIPIEQLPEPERGQARRELAGLHQLAHLLAGALGDAERAEFHLKRADAS